VNETLRWSAIEKPDAEFGLVRAHLLAERALGDE